MVFRCVIMYPTKYLQYLSLSNSWFTGAFVIVGTVAGVRRKSYLPLASAALLGSLGDAIYGYYFGCADIIKDYENSKTAV